MVSFTSISVQQCTTAYVVLLLSKVPGVPHRMIIGAIWRKADLLTNHIFSNASICRRRQAIWIYALTHPLLFLGHELSDVWGNADLFGSIPLDRLACEKELMGWWVALCMKVGCGWVDWVNRSKPDPPPLPLLLSSTTTRRPLGSRTKLGPSVVAWDAWHGLDSLIITCLPSDSRTVLRPRVFVCVGCVELFARTHLPSGSCAILGPIVLAAEVSEGPLTTKRLPFGNWTTLRLHPNPLLATEGWAKGERGTYPTKSPSACGVCTIMRCLIKSSIVNGLLTWYIVSIDTFSSLTVSAFDPLLSELRGKCCGPRTLILRKIGLEIPPWVVGSAKCIL